MFPSLHDGWKQLGVVKLVPGSGDQFLLGLSGEFAALSIEPVDRAAGVSHPAKIGKVFSQRPELLL